MQQSTKIITVTCLGTILEWAEFTFYAYIATIISALFFPDIDQRAGMIATFGIFAIGYLMRPLGAILFGYIGDRYGRRTALLSSIMLMGISAMSIGLLPTYHTIGILAPILLLLFRCLQGLAVSGEFNGSSIFLMEHAKKSPYFAASWTGWAAAIGMTLGSFSAMIVVLPSMAEMAEWAWRIPFLAGSLICVCGMYLRLQLDETPTFLALQSNGLTANFPLQKVLQKNLKNFILAIVLASAFGVYIYVGNLFYASFLINSANLPTYQAKLVVTVGALCVVLLFPFIANLADRVGGKKVMMIGFALIIIAGPMLYLVVLTHSLMLILATQLFYAIADAMVGAPLFRFINILFPANVRYTGASFSWSLSMALFAGTAPLLSMWLEIWTHLSYAPAFYISLAGVIGIMALIYITKNHNNKNNHATKTLRS